MRHVSALVGEESGVVVYPSVALEKIGEVLDHMALF
jgi:hypothetical protein